MYANADATFVNFLFDLSTMNYYDEDDYTTVKGLDKIRIRNIGYGDGATSELWVYNILFWKKPSVWNYGADTYPSITADGALDVDNDLVPSYTAASESDGGMYLNTNDDTDLPLVIVTESSSSTSAISALVNLDNQLQDGDVLPLNWRKLKFESDQTGTNKEDDHNFALLPSHYVPTKIRTGEYGIVVEEVFKWDMSGMQDIDTSDYLLTWDSTTDKIYVEDFLDWNKMASDIWTGKDPAKLVEGAWEGLESTYDAINDLKGAWASETDESYIQYTLVKQPSTTTGDILKFVRHVRYDKGVIEDVPEKQGSPLANATLLGVVGLGGVGLGLIGIILVAAKVLKKKSGRR